METRNISFSKFISFLVKMIKLLVILFMIKLSLLFLLSFLSNYLPIHPLLCLTLPPTVKYIYVWLNLFYYLVLLTVESSLAPSPLLASAETEFSLKEADIKPYEKGENLKNFYHSKFLSSQCHFKYYLHITLCLSCVGMHRLQTQIKTILENYVHCNTQPFCAGGDTDDPG